MFQPALYAATNLVTHSENAGVRDRVDDRSPVATTGENTRISQRLKMTRDVGLAEPGGLDQFTDTLVPLLEGYEKLKTVWLAQGLETVGDEIQGLVREFLRRYGRRHNCRNFFLVILNICAYSYMVNR